MTNLRCPQCNFANFHDSTGCKKCGEPLGVHLNYQQLKQDAAARTHHNQLANVENKPIIERKKKPVFNLILWSLTGIGSFAGGLLLIVSALSEMNAIQQSSAASIAIGCAVIPYCLARATDETTL